MKRVYQRTRGKGREVCKGRQAAAVALPLPVVEAVEDFTERVESFCVEVGVEMMRALLAEEVEQKAGPRYRHDPCRQASRNGHQRGYVVVFGQKVPIWRERVRDGSGREVELERYGLFQRDGRMERQVGKLLMRKMSQRDYAGAVELLAEGYGVKKSSVSRHWKRMTAEQARRLCERDLSDRDWVAIVLDAKGFGDWTVTVVLGVDSSGQKRVLGLRQGSTENAEVCRSLLADIVERGVDPERRRFYIVDGAKALTTAVRKMFGEKAEIQRCQVHKRRNVREHLPPEHQEAVDGRLRSAYGMRSYDEAKRSLLLTVKYLERLNPSAARSLEEGLEETLTLHRLGAPDELRRSLSSTNLIESCFSMTEEWTRRAKRWRNGEMVYRWAGTALLEAERRFRRVRGYRAMGRLVLVLDNRVDSSSRIA
jgi:transposase-like protein